MKLFHWIAWLIPALLSVWIISAASGVASYPRPLRLIMISQTQAQPQIPPSQLSPLRAVLSYHALSPGTGSYLAQESITPTPTYDPLATPVMPENPTQLDIGRMLYYYNCMPCHGDLGQGLTDEFRMVWEEDHRDCWGRNCHAGRPKDEGFPIPTVIPAVMAETDALPGYTDPEALLSYLRLTHPPQEPGRLQENEYRALGALLWASNGKPGGLEAFATLPASYATASAAAPHIIMNDPATETPAATPAVMVFVSSTPTPAPTFTVTAELPSPTPAFSPDQNTPSALTWLGGLALGILLLVASILAWAQRKRLRRDDEAVRLKDRD